MKTYYRLQIRDGECWLPTDERFDTTEAAEKFRDDVIADSDEWAYYFVVELGCPTRIMKITEEVVQEFQGLPVGDEA